MKISYFFVGAKTTAVRTAIATQGKKMLKVLSRLVLRLLMKQKVLQIKSQEKPHYIDLKVMPRQLIFKILGVLIYSLA